MSAKRGLGIGMLLTAIGPWGVLAATPDQELLPLRAGSRSPYVHRIGLYDGAGVAIAPKDTPAVPYSPRATCGKCHNYVTISSGWHFNAGGGTSNAGRGGEPWILTDALSATQLPVSARRWPGTYRPEDVGLTRWKFALSFGRHLPGGGIVEPDAATLTKEPQAARWRVCGVIEIDCMVCHSNDARHDASESGCQIEKENFKWAPTAASGLAVVRGEARKAPDDWDPLLPADPDYPERAGPAVVYDASRFDADDRVFFDITRRPPEQRCYFCHTVREVGAGSPQTWNLDRDVHLSAGLGCTDCHRHGLDHAMIRGYEEQPVNVVYLMGADMTCRGCHLGEGLAAGFPSALGGRLGAPRPLHRGLPPLHLERLTCTTCHAGPWPTGRVRRWQTAMAHGLGIASKERSDSTPPEIFGPAYQRQGDGRIGPYRMMWPAFWGRSSVGMVTPLPLDEVSAAVRQALPDRVVQPYESKPLASEQILRVLEVLAARDAQDGEYVFVGSGRAHRRTPTGQLETFEHAAASAYSWPIGHDVRPAAQSLGAAGCTDCHAEDAPFSFGKVIPDTGEQSERPPLEFMYELQGKSPIALRVWASSFAFRTAFKIVGFGCAGVLAAVLFIYGLAALSSLLRMCR